MKKLPIAVLLALILGVMLAGCTEADKVSKNISQEADNFNVIRRISVINTRTDKPIFELIAAFSITVDKEDNQLEITCEAGDGIYKKHFIGLNEWTTYFVEDISGASVDKYRYEVNFLPEALMPVTITNED